MAIRCPLPCTAGSSCHLSRSRTTVIAITSFTEGRHLLPVGDQRLKDLLRMKISLG
jgi:hypothetical protein